MIRVICDIRGLTLCWQIFAFVNRGDFLFWLNRGLRGSNGFNSPQGYKCAERQDRINKMQTKKLLKLARLPVRSALPIAAFTLITRTAPCLRQLPSCVAVYPRDTHRDVFYVARVPAAPLIRSCRRDSSVAHTDLTVHVARAHGSIPELEIDSVQESCSR